MAKLNMYFNSRLSTTPEYEPWQVFAFKSEKNDWQDLLKDKNIKKFIQQKIEWSEHLLLYMNERFTVETGSYISLKYSDIVVPINEVITDFSPKKYKDYLPVYKIFKPIKQKIICF